MKKLLLIIIILIVIVATNGGAFYGGMKYAEGWGLGSFRQGNFQNLSSEERQQRIEEMGANLQGGIRGQGARQNNGLIAGEIISKDDQGIIIKMPDGGSKIIFYSEATKISRTVDGNSGDLTVGKNINANGTQNQDGSTTAETIQIRP